MSMLELSEDPGISDGLLLREMAHRFLNQITCAVCAISEVASHCGSDQERALLADVAGQLCSYADLQRFLQAPSFDYPVDTSEYFSQLCEVLATIHSTNKGIELLFVDNGLVLDSGRCWRLAMIVSELVANAAKHGFAGCTGAVRIELRKFGSVFECVVDDNGKSSASSHPGSGTGVVAAIAQDLGGHFYRRFGSDGTTCVIRFPAPGSENYERGSLSELSSTHALKET